MRQATHPMQDSSWARHAQAANGFGDAAVALDHRQTFSGHPATAPHSRRPHSWTRRFGRAVRALVDAVRATAATRRRRQLARETFLVLHTLDARTLRDVGFDRSEIASVAREVAGLGEASRAHPERFLSGR